MQVNCTHNYMPDNPELEPKIEPLFRMLMYSNLFVIMREDDSSYGAVMEKNEPGSVCGVNIEHDVRGFRVE